MERGPGEILKTERGNSMATTTKKDLIERVAQDTERDYFMSAEEAKDYGIVDRVIEHH